MNNVTLMGRLTRDPEVRYSQNGEKATCIARYTLAVNRTFGGKDGQPTADFISCVAFGKAGEFTEKYLKKGMQICLRGRIQTGSYTNKDGQKVYTTDIVVENQEFAEKKNAASEGTPDNPATQNDYVPQSQGGMDEFMSLPDEGNYENPFVE